MTSHIEAKKEKIAKTVIMPGDPLRAKFIAKTFLNDVKRVNTIRNMFMYTGKYKGKEVSVCGSGMGQPSIAIYSYELFKFYEVDNIIRVGSSGSYKKDLKLYDVVLVKEAYSESKVFSKLIAGIDTHVMKPSRELNEKIKKSAQEVNCNLKEVRTYSTDVFYSSRSLEETIIKTEADCVEMESAALFANAKLLNKNAATILTISDNLITNEETTARERQNTFCNMIKIALNTIKVLK